MEKEERRREIESRPKEEEEGIRKNDANVQSILEANALTKFRIPTYTTIALTAEQLALLLKVFARAVPQSGTRVLDADAFAVGSAIRFTGDEVFEDVTRYARRKERAGVPLFLSLESRERNTVSHRGVFARTCLRQPSREEEK